MTTTLPPQGPHEPDDELPGEAGLAALYRKLPQNEPGPALDAAILHAAAQAIAPTDAPRLAHGERRKAAREPGDWVHPKPVTDIAPARQPRPSPASRASRHRTLVALGSAASLVLVAGLAWRMRDMPSQEAAPAARDALKASAVTNAPVVTATAMPPGTAARAAVDRAMSEHQPAAGRATADVGANAVPAPAEPMAQPDLATRERKPAIVAITATPIVEPPAPPISRRPETDKAMAGRASAADRSDARVQSLETATAPVPGARSLAPAAPAMVAPPQPVEEMSSAPTEPAPSMQDTPPAPPAPPAPAAPQFAPRVSGGLPAGGSQAQEAGPAQVRELDAIRKLFADHHDDEGQRRLEAFHRLHPQWQLPPDLQARLHKP